MLPSISIPTSNLYIIYQLKKHGYDGYLVGGSVRDLIAQQRQYYQAGQSDYPLDFDFTTNAHPTEIMSIFPKSFYENNFGTVSITPNDLLSLITKETKNPPDSLIRKEQNLSPEQIPLCQATKIHQSLTSPVTAVSEKKTYNFEITTYRTGEKYENNHRQPSQLSWGKNIEADLARRDFTINALALTIPLEELRTIFQNKQWQTHYQFDNYQLIDQYNGISDLKLNLIKAIGDPLQRFQEDALRLIRAVRLSVQLNFSIESATYDAIKQHAALIKTISGERIRDEFLKILASNFPKEGIMLLEETNLLQEILPELLACRGIAQSGHHLTDVWTHSLDALSCCTNPDPIVRLSTLLHDIGKPATHQLLGGKNTFYNHQLIGAFMAKKIAQRLRLSKKDTQRIFILVRQHMFHYQPQNTDAAIRRFMRQVGLENLNDMLDLREADRLGSNARKTSWRLEEMKKRIIAQLNQPLEVRDLEINGHDLMTEFNLKPGPQLGRILNNLLEQVLENCQLNTKEKLLALAAEIIKNED